MIVDDPRIPRLPPVALVPDSPGPDEEADASESEMPLPSPQTFFLGVFSCSAFWRRFTLKLDHSPHHARLRVETPSAARRESPGAYALTKRLRSALAILLVIGSLVGLVAALSVPAATWSQRLPEGIPRLEAHLAVLKAPIEALQKVIQQAEQVADTGTTGSVVQVHRDLGLTGALFAGTRAVLDGLFTTVLVLYFLLVSGDIFLRRVVEVLPKFKDKATSRRHLSTDRGRHLCLSGDDHGHNAAVGVATATAMYLCGLGYLGARVLVLDVGRAWRHPGCSVAGHGQDRL